MLLTLDYAFGSVLASVVNRRASCGRDEAESSDTLKLHLDEDTAARVVCVFSIDHLVV